MLAAASGLLLTAAPAGADIATVTGPWTGTTTRTPNIPPARVQTSSYSGYFAGPFNYTLYTFTVDADGSYGASITTTNVTNTSWFLTGLFDPGPAPTTPISNFFSGFFAGGTAPYTDIYSGLMLNAETTYSILLAYNSQSPSLDSIFTISLSGPGCIAIDTKVCVVAPSVVDSSQSFFTFADPAAAGSTVTFDGGTLRLTDAGSSNQAITVLSTGGTIDSNGQTVVLSGPIDNAGRLVITGGGVVKATGDISGDGVTEVADGELSLDGAFTGELIVGADGTLRGVGTISGPTDVAGTLRPGNSPGALTFTAPVTLADSATLALDIDGVGTGAGAGNYSRVLVEGSSITVAGTIAPVLRGLTGSATNVYTPPLGERFIVIRADDGVSGSFSGLAQPSDGLAAGTRFDALYGANDLALVVTPADYGDLASVGLAQSSNQQAAGAALQGFRPAAGLRLEGDAGEVFTSLYGLPGSEVAGALDAVAGAVHGDALVGRLSTQRQLGGLVERRLAALRSDQAGAIQQAASAGLTSFQLAMSSNAGGLFDGLAGPAFSDSQGAAAGSSAKDGGLRSWVQGFGSFARQDDNGAPGFDSVTGAAVAGGDVALTPSVVLGGALGYAHSELDSDASARADIDTVQLTGYAGASRGRAFLDAQVYGAWSRTETTRDLDFGGLDRTAKATGHGLSAGSALRVGYRLDAWGVSFEPSAGLRYDHVQEGSVTERGAGALSLTVDPKDLDALRATLGLRADATIRFAEATLVPEGRLGWAHELADTGAASSQSLAAGGAFVVDSNRLDRDFLLVGAGVSALVAADLKVFADYDAEISEHGTNHIVAAGLRFIW